MKNILVLLLLLNCLPAIVFAQGIKGTVYDHNSHPLSFASIYIAELNDGASTNEQGQYEISLKPGTYNLFVQYIGFEKQQFQVEVKEDWVQKDIIFKEQVFLLKEVEVKSRREDPALTIMRKAIAKRKFHLLQYDSYQVRVYIKGTGQITKAPFFLKKTIEKEGVKFNEAYTSESVSEIKFEQPDKIEEKVISIRTSGDNSGSASPSTFINQSFYNDKVAEAVSPLSGSAFAYYKFRYEGSFKEGGYEINKIRVIPRSKGEQVFDGFIYIIEDFWAIHSLDLKTSYMGFQIHAIQNYEEVAQNVWMAVTHQYNFGGKVLGFAGEYKYLASCSDYKVELNNDLLSTTQIIDEKIEDVPKEIKIPLPSQKEEIVDVLENQDKMTRKQFRKMIVQYEKESVKEREEPEVVNERTYSVDSMATKRDSLYWADIRPVPLSDKEIKGYHRDDSIAVVNKGGHWDKEESDSTQSNPKKHRRFKPEKLLLGGHYRLSPNVTMNLNPIITQVYYNTVEGFNVNASADIIYIGDSLQNGFSIKPTVRYGFASEDVYYKTRISKHSINSDKKRDFFVEGGKFVEQFNDEEPIHPLINTLSSLIFRRNYMKIYEKLYAKANFSFTPSLKWFFTGNVEWAQRNELFEQTNFSFFYNEPREFSFNQPVNIEMIPTGFQLHQALLLKMEVRYRPGIVYKINNGHKSPDYSRAPTFTLKYNKGIPGILSSDVNFDQLEFGVVHDYKFGISGKLRFEISGGAILNNKKMFFMDYQHFDGNRTVLSSLRPAGAYRLLDYYIYSTRGNYLAAHTHYQFRKFLITQLPEIRFSGLRENIFVNYLKTSSSPSYYELGYSLDNIFKILRVEVAASFADTEFQEVGLRIGIATLIDFNIK